MRPEIGDDDRARVIVQSRLNFVEGRAAADINVLVCKKLHQDGCERNVIFAEHYTRMGHADLLQPSWSVLPPEGLHRLPVPRAARSVADEPIRSGGHAWLRARCRSVWSRLIHVVGGRASFGWHSWLRQRSVTTYWGRVVLTSRYRLV